MFAVLDWMKKEQFYNLVMCLVWNLCPENPQQGVVSVPFVIQDSCLLISAQTSQEFFGTFLFNYDQNRFNTVRQERLEESLFASKINCFLENLPQMHAGVWSESHSPSLLTSRHLCWARDECLSRCISQCDVVKYGRETPVKITDFFKCN